MSAEPIIPAEIVESIIEQLSDDKKALLNCSLVCKAWVPACRYRLFCQQLIRAPEHWDILRHSDILHVYARAVKLTCLRPPKESNTLDELEEILHPLLGFFLIKLPRSVVRRLLPDIRKHQFIAELMQLTFPRITFLVVKMLFTHARRWTKPEESHRDDYALLEKLPIIFPRVTTLDLLDSFRTFRETIQCNCSFPELETLTINSHTWHDIDSGNVGCFRLPVGLKTVRCISGLSKVTRFIEWLSVTEPTPRLVALTFIQFHWANMGSLSRLLSKVGKTLQHLRLVPDPCSFAELGSPFSMSDTVFRFLVLGLESSRTRPTLFKGRF